MSIDWLRRNSLPHLHPVERMIRETAIEVEKLGASPALTDTVTQLEEARQSLADHLEEHAGFVKTVQIEAK